MGSKKITESERLALIEKLNKETDKFIEEKKSKNFEYKDGFTSENIDEILSTHPAFMKGGDLTQEQIEANPLLKGLQMIKYEDPDDSAYDRSLAHKNDGNYWFKLKKYKNACKAYTEALKQKCSDQELLTILYSNRSAANFHLQNYRSSLLDATMAVKLDSKRVKSLLRCAQCCEALKQFENAINWCEVILALEENETAKTIRVDCIKKKKIRDRDERKKKMQKEKENKMTRSLMKAVMDRKITLANFPVATDEDDEAIDELTQFLSSIKGPTGKQVYHGENGLVWPVLFLYPQYATSDFIEEFDETSCFVDHLNLMFEEVAEWDLKQEYKLKNLKLFVENQDANKIYEIFLSTPLHKVLSHRDIVVKTGTPAFIVLSKSSSFYDQFLGRYSKKPQELF